MILNKLTKNRFWIFLILLFLFLRLPSLFEPYWYGDEGIYLVLGQAVRRGLTLYRHIHDNKPPTLYYLAAIAQTVFGFRLLLLAVMVPTIIFYYQLSKKFFSFRLSKISTFVFTLISSVPFIEGTISNAEVFMLLPTILAVYLILSSPKKLSYFVSGLLLGLAFTIKVPVAIEVAFLSFWIILENIDFSLKAIGSKLVKTLTALAIFSFAFTLPISIIAAYYYVRGAGGDFLFSALLQNFGYLSSWSTGSHASSVASGGIITRFVAMLFSWVILIALYSTNFLNKKFLFLYLWFSATIFGVLLPARPYPHYLIQSLPPLALIITSLFLVKSSGIKTISLVSMFTLISLTFKYKFYFFPTITYYTNFYTYAFGKKDVAAYRSHFGPYVNSVYKISQYIKTNTNPNDRIFVWGDEPYVYALSDRLPSGKYTVSYHIVDFNGHQDTINSLKAYPPKYIVYYHMPHRPFPQLDNFILKYYSLDHLIDSAYIFKRR